MKFVSYRIGGQGRYGIVQGKSVYDLSQRFGARLADLRAFIGAPDWRTLTSQALAGGIRTTTTTRWN